MKARPDWWQWPTILSLDAPAVGVAWQLLLARVADVDLRGAHVAILGATVWLAYAADRWIEGWRLDSEAIQTQRHQFYQQRRWPVAILWVGVCVVDIGVALTALTWREIAAGLMLMVPVLLYLLSHQLIHRHRRWRAPKELCVAALMTGGVCVFLLSSSHRGDVVASASLFALLCFTNCALISSWEREVDLAHGQTSLAIDAVTHGWAIPQLPWLIAVLSGVALFGDVGPPRTVAACALFSAVLLAIVDWLERRAGRRVARVLADVALLTPIVPLWWIR